MSSAAGTRADARRNGAASRPLTTAGEDLLRIGIPPGTPEEARVAIRRLVELTSVLSERAAQLQHALDSRVVIEQAKGVLVERHALDPDEAFQVLRRGARSNRMRIHDLAARVVSSREAPPELADGGLPVSSRH